MSADHAPTLVVGATGTMGGLVCSELVAAGTPVRALVRPGRSEHARARLGAQGAELVEGDLKDRASLERALDGVAVAVSTGTATLPHHQAAGDSIDSVDRDGNRRLVDACATAGVAHLVYVSSTSRDDGPATSAKRAVEEHLRASGLAHTIVRASRFMEIWFSPRLGFDVANARAQVFGSGENPVSWVCREDAARFVARCAREPAAVGAMTLALGGPEPLSQLEVVGIFEALTGRRFTIDRISESELRRRRATEIDPVLESYAAFMLDCASGDAVVDPAPALRHHPMSLTSVRAFARSTLDAWHG